MQHHVHTAQRAIYRHRISDIADNQLGIPVEIFRGLTRCPVHLCGEIIEQPDLESCRQENIGCMRTDETCSACDKNSHHPTAFVGAELFETDLTPWDSP